MACALLPAGATAAAALPSPRRSAAVSKGHPNQVAYMYQLYLKLPLQAARSRSFVGCCTCSGSSVEAATSSKSAHVLYSHKDVSMRETVDAVPGAHIVISGYWTGPDMDDGWSCSGHSAKDFLIMYRG